MEQASKRKAACICTDDLEAVAREGVERAIAARETCVELTAEEAGAVGGAAYSTLISKWIIAGGRPYDIYGIGGLTTDLGGMTYGF